jgi:hypothetical protein
MAKAIMGQFDRTAGLRFYRFAFWFLLAIGLVAAVGSVVAMMYAGIGWDARMDTGQSVVIREVVPNLPAGSSLEVAYDKIYFTAEFYGILLPQLGDFLNSILTGSILSGSQEMLQLNDMAAYRLQGLASVAIAALAAGSLGFAIASALKSRLAGAFAWALIMTTPLYFGMSSVNIKDMPVAAGLTLITSGFMLNRSAKTTWVRWGVAIALTAAGSSIALATRPGLWPLVLIFAGMILGLYGLLDLRHRSPGKSLPGVSNLVVSVAVTLLFLWWTNPLGRLSLFQWLSDSFTVMRNYPWEGTIRTASVDVVSTDLPWWYVPAWLLAQLPIVTTVIIVAGFIATVASLLQRRWALPRSQVAVMSPVFLQAIVLPVAVVVSGATLYDALRHLLFMIPALIGIGAIAVATLEKSNFDWKISPKAAASVVTVIVVGLSAFATARWIPYSYAFINPIAGWNHPERDWELDFWGLTAAEGVERLKDAGYTPIGVLPIEETAGLFGGSSLAVILEEGQSAPFGLYVFKRWDSSIGECESLFTIERDGQLLGEGAVCPPVDPA